MSEEKAKRPGPGPGPGRPVGSTNKISGVSILASIEKTVGQKFEDLLADGYHAAILANDKPTRLQYEKMFLAKVVADKAELDVTSAGQPLTTVFQFVHKKNDSFDK